MTRAGCGLRPPPCPVPLPCEEPTPGLASTHSESTPRAPLFPSSAPSPPHPGTPGPPRVFHCDRRPMVWHLAGTRGFWDRGSVVPRSADVVAHRLCAFSDGIRELHFGKIIVILSICQLSICARSKDG
ncbi:uncharacterized protein LOC120706561 [Panicum virgatum]|uniref:uncharacterized protein LOC120706561 n=1 Tax=Panicum virgatum TaxID=38727 RepID=UPI0019D581CE|nr:uncharacterized protein LOC120706561 [Panicum virgatum]